MINPIRKVKMIEKSKSLKMDSTNSPIKMPVDLSKSSNMGFDAR
jgi:hypothetical protein